MPFQNDPANDPERSAYDPSQEPPDLTEAAARLRQFRMSQKGGDMIDERSKLTTADLDTILGFLADFPSTG